MSLVSRHTRTAFVVLALTFAGSAASAQDLYKPAPGPYTVHTINRTWKDPARTDREIPVHIYIPEPADKTAAPTDHKFPVIIFSHGLGGAGTNYTYFGNHLASQGFLVLAPTHAGSDTAALRQWLKSHTGAAAAKTAESDPQDNNWLKSSINDPANLRNRPLDISFLVGQLTTDEQLAKLADPSHVGVAGHSFGAYTAMAVGGMTIDLPDEKGKSFRDPRIKAILPMSPEGPGVMGITESSWDKFAAPVMFLTGTRDYGVGERSADWRRAGFEHVKGFDDFLITLNGAGHMTFGTSADKDDTADGPGSKLRDRIRDRIRERANGGRMMEAKDTNQAHHTDMIESLSTAFFDAYLRDDAAAKAWLTQYSMAKHGDCTAEYRPAAAKSP